jgi:hypothetical protein
LNMAEIVALHVLNIQCLNRHTATIEYMEWEITAAGM